MSVGSLVESTAVDAASTDPDDYPPGAEESYDAVQEMTGPLFLPDHDYLCHGYLHECDHK